MDESQSLILRQIARLLTIGCVLLAVCAGLLVKVALDTHATRPRPWSAYADGPALGALLEIRKGGTIDAVIPDGDRSLLVGH